MSKYLVACLIVLVLTGIPLAQNPKPWTEWSKKDAEKTLNDSAWAQTQTETDTSEMTYSPTVTPVGSAGNASRGLDSRGESGAKNSPIAVKYHVRLLSARPIREAFSRLVLISQEKATPQLIEQLNSFVNRDFADYIVVAVTFDTTDARMEGPVRQAFSGVTADLLKNATYLERKDGKRLFLMDYRSPIKDGMGAKFVFPRVLDEKAFITEDAGAIRFYSEVNSKIKINVKFKVSDLVYAGRLEY
jgi:hypothetical protein